MKLSVFTALILVFSFSTFAQTPKAKVKAATKKTTETSASTTFAPAPSASPTTAPSSARSHSLPITGAYADLLNEVQTSFSGGSFNTGKVGTQTTTTLNINGSYARLIKEKIQAGGEVGISYVNATTTNTTFSVMGLGKYNFTDDLRNSFYVDAGIGLFSVANSTGGNDTKFGFMVGGGRRIPLWERISYNPEARLYKKGDLDPNIEIQFLNLSLMF